jgi:hypothetical protein
MESLTIPQGREKQAVMIQVSSGLQTTEISILIYTWYLVLIRHAANRTRSGRNAEVHKVVVDELCDMRVTVSPLLLHALDYGDIQTGQSAKLNYISSN